MSLPAQVDFSLNERLPPPIWQLGLGPQGQIGAVDLHESPHFAERNKFSIDPFEPGQVERVITRTVALFPSASQSAADQYRRLEELVAFARRAMYDKSEPYWVELGIRSVSRGIGSFLVTSGTVTVIEMNALGWWRVELKLVVHPTALGTPEPLPVFADATGFGAYRIADVDTDDPTDLELELTDASLGGQIIQQFTLWRRSGRILDVTDFQGMYELEAYGAGVEVDEADSGGLKAIQAPLPGTGWFTIGKVSPSDMAGLRGQFLVRARVKSSAVPLNPVTGLTLTTTGASVAIVSLVQKASNTAVPISGAWTCNTNWAGTTTEGNTLIAVGRVARTANSAYDFDPITLTGAGSDDWSTALADTVISAPVGDPHSGDVYTGVWYKENAASESGTVHLEATSNDPGGSPSGHMTLQLFEIANLRSSNIIIQTAYTQGPRNVTLQPINLIQSVYIFASWANMDYGSISGLASGYSNGLTEQYDIGSIAVASGTVAAGMVRNNQPQFTPGQLNISAASAHKTLMVVLVLGIETEAETNFLPAGVYNVRVQAQQANGSRSAPTSTVSITLYAGLAQFTAHWTAPVGGGASGYVVTVTAPDGQVREFLTTTTSLTIKNMADGLPVGSLPSGSGVASPFWLRAAVGLRGSGMWARTQTTVPSGPPDVWQDIDIGLIAIPPTTLQRAGDDVLSDILIEARNDGGPSAPILIDRVYLIPLEGYLTLTHPTYGLAQQARWVFKHYPDGTKTAVVRDKVTGAIIGPLRWSGDLRLERYDTLLYITAARAAGGLLVSDVLQLRWQLSGLYTPRYRFVTGTSGT